MSPSLIVIVALWLLRMLLSCWFPPPTPPAVHAERAAAVDPCLGPIFDSPTVRLDRSEATLVGRLLAGAITQQQYRTEMQAIATQDAEVHPLVIPPQG